jgi:glycosidase
VFFLYHLSLAQDHENWSYNLGMYEVNMRQYTPDGTFAAFSEHLDRLQDMGIGILWFMPIHPIGEKNRLGSLGSYYSVQNYLDVNPEYGTLEEFKALVQNIHQRGMYVIIDWVANHTSWDNVLTTEHPEWYVTDANGNFIAPPGTNWSDVIELDYTHQELRDYMINAMSFWVTEIGVDGFRCDAVSFVPNDFWLEAISQLKSTRSDLLFLAEGDGREWHNLGFDMSYGWGLYGFGNGVLKRIADGVNNANNFHSYAGSEKSTYPEKYRMYFTSNHDENSWHGTTSELFGNAAEVCAVLTCTFNGMPLIYSGQEAGLDKRLAFFDKDDIPWQEHPNRELYTTLLHLKKEHKALWNGKNGGLMKRVKSNNNADIYALIRQKDTDRVCVIMNLSDQETRAVLESADIAGEYQNVFNNETVTMSDSTTITLSPWEYVVYTGTADTKVLDMQQPKAFELGQNYPNPFNSETKISFSLTSPAFINLSLYNLHGKVVRTLLSEFKAAGSYDFSFYAENLSSGLYFYQLASGTQIGTKQLLLIK